MREQVFIRLHFTLIVGGSIKNNLANKVLFIFNSVSYENST